MFDAQWQELQRLWGEVEISREEQAACRQAIKEQAYTVDCLQLLSRQIARLQPRVDASNKLRMLIEERTGLIERMKQFEQSASNPNRLFGSSFQLLQEEKFRKTAYPNLIKLETAIEQALSEWAQLTGDPFILNGQEWVRMFEEEKATRWINEAFFEFKRDKRKPPTEIASAPGKHSVVVAKTPVRTKLPGK